MKDYIRVGKIVNTHGVRGCLKCLPLTDDIERFDELEYVFTENDDQKRKIINVWNKKGMVYITLENINDMNTAESFRDTYISILEEQLKVLPENTYYIYELEGLSVYSTEGQYIGDICNVFQTGANDIYEVKLNDKSYLIPAVSEVVKEVNIKDKKMVIDVIPGLLE